MDVLTRHYDSGELAGNSFESTYSSVEEMKEPYRVVDHIIYTNFEDNNENRRPLYTGPSNLDPSTIGPVEKKKFNGEDIPDELVKQKVQQLQDINI